MQSSSTAGVLPSRHNSRRPVVVSVAVTSVIITVVGAVAWAMRSQLDLPPTSVIPPNHYRLRIEDITDTTTERFLLLRITTPEQRSLSIDRPSDGGGQRTSTYHQQHADPNTGEFSAFVTIIVDHVPAAGTLKVLSQIGGSSGRAGAPDSFPVDNTAVLSDVFQLTASPGVYPITDSHQLFTLFGKSATLSVE